MKLFFHTQLQLSFHTQRIIVSTIQRRIIAFMLCASIVLCALHTASIQLHAQEMPVPVKLHVAMLAKVLTFNKSLKGQPKIVVLFTDATVPIKDEALKSFAALGMTATALKADQLSKYAGDANVVYSAAKEIPIQKFAQDNGLFSITGIPALVENGIAAMSVGTEAGRPKLFVNMTQLKAQKQDVSSEVLKLCKVY